MDLLLIQGTAEKVPAIQPEQFPERKIKQSGAEIAETETESVTKGLCRHLFVHVCDCIPQ